MPMQETQVQSLACKDSLEEGMETHSSILAWRTPWMERSRTGYSPWSPESDTQLKQLSTHIFHNYFLKKISMIVNLYIFLMMKLQIIDILTIFPR